MVHCKRPPWYQPRHIELTIGSGNKEDEQQQITSFIVTHPSLHTLIYTNGSAHPTKGLRAVATMEDGTKSMKSYCGPTNRASNFECKVMGIILGIELGLSFIHSGTTTNITILSNSQATLRRICSPYAPLTGQYLLIKLSHLLDQIPTDAAISFIWCLGHMGIPGNEKADKLANSAAPNPATNHTLALQAPNLTRKITSKVKKSKLELVTDFPILAIIHQLQSGHV